MSADILKFGIHSQSDLDPESEIEQLRLFESFYRNAARQAKIAFWRWCYVKEELTHWSESYEEIDALSPLKQPTDEEMLKVVHEDDRERVRQVYADAYGDETDYDVEYRIVEKDGSIRWLHELAEIEHGEDGKPVSFFGILQDITERKELEWKLQALASTDALTGLLNRREFDEQLARALVRISRTGTALALLVIDMDGFKRVNDEFGHDAGDTVLKMAAERIEGELRKSDIAGRMGGDEFIVFLEGKETRESAALVAGKLVDALNAPYQLPDGGVITLSASMGVALAPDDGEDLGAMFSKADAAMYKAKKSGKNRYVSAAE